MKKVICLTLVFLLAVLAVGCDAKKGEDTFGSTEAPQTTQGAPSTDEAPSTGETNTNEPDTDDPSESGTADGGSEGASDDTSTTEPVTNSGWTKVY